MISEQASAEAKADSQIAFEQLAALKKGPKRKPSQLDSILMDANVRDHVQRQLVIKKLMLKLNKNMESHVESNATFTKVNMVRSFHFGCPKLAEDLELLDLSAPLEID